MADKNFARSGTADTDLLADDDPLSELARLVNFEPRPVQDVAKSFSEPVQVTSRHENPVLALEDELMRAFEQYDAPAVVGAEPVVAGETPQRDVEPVFEEPVPVVEEETALPDEVPALDVAGDYAEYREPVFEEPAIEPAFIEDAAEPDVVEDIVPDAQPVEVEPEPELEFDPALLLADELETAVHEVPSVEAEPTVHTGQLFAERFEPRFEEPARSEPAAEAYTPENSDIDRREPAFLGLQPLSADENPLADVGIDLEHELELSIGDGFADDLLVDDSEVTTHAAAAFAEPVPVSVEAIEAAGEPDFGSWMPRDVAGQDAEPFHAEPVYERDEPHFVAEMPFETREDRARVVAEAESLWQTEAGEPVFDAEPAYQVESVGKGQDYDHDALLAEVERYPVPDTSSPLAASTIVAATVATTPRSQILSSPSIFGRATPVAHRAPAVEKTAPSFFEPVAAPVSATFEAPVAEARHEPVALPTPAVAAEPEVDFESLEFDLSNIDLDLSDFSLDDEPVKQEVKAAEMAVPETRTPEIKAEAARPAEVEIPVRREPSVAVPVSAYTTPHPVAVEANDGALPFDPSMIADTDEGVSPVTELDVPQLPVIEKEKPHVYQPDYDFDIDAEMAQLFTEPAAKTRNEDLQAGVAAGAVAASLGQPAAQISDVDDFERALEEDFRRSLSQPERLAIPVDPGQASTLYSGDGYDDEEVRPRRGLMIAASIAALVLIGGGGVYAWTSFAGGTAGSDEPRVILADKGPVKIVPEEKGGKTVPNQDKAVYDRVAGDTAATPQQEQLVTSTEEPVDVVQRTLTPETLPFDGPEDGVEAVIQADDENRLLPGVDEPETATAEGGNQPLVSPRKVKTMIVKPDGTLVAREETVTEPVTETAQLDAKATATTGGSSGEAVATVDADASLRAEQAAGEGQPRSALAEVADTQVDDTAPIRTVKTTTIGATATTTDSNTPVPETRPIDQPVTVVGTVTENGNVRGTQTAEATPTATETRQAAQQTEVAALAPGSYVIQIASLPSEAEAQKSYNSLSSKFGSVIGGRGVDIRKAEIPNKGTYFRVRIPAGSREEANSLCNRYKSAGGSCLVTR